jgi:hypothetical protein
VTSLFLLVIIIPDITVNQMDRCPDWGVRNLEEVTSVASSNDFFLERTFDMPANNLTVVFRKSV